MSSDAGSIPAASTKPTRGEVDLNKRILTSLAVVWLAGSLSPLFSQSPRLRLSAKDHPGFCRVTIAASLPLKYSLERAGSNLLVNIESSAAFRIQRETLQSEFVRSIGWSKGGGSYTLLIELKFAAFSFEHSVRENPYQLIIDLRRNEAPESKPAPPAPAAEKREAPPPASGAALQPSPVIKGKTGEQGGGVPPPVNQGSLNTDAGGPASAARNRATDSRAGSERGQSAGRLKTIVIDPGHGGLEVGAKGKFGTLEKDITLAIGLKLKAVVERNLAFRVVMTRDKDGDITLENRAALANNHKADIFISVHTNGSSRKKAQGSETFFLSLNATDEESRRLAYMENTSDALEGQIDKENKDDIRMILWDLAQTAYLKQSSKLAEIIQSELNELLGTRNRGIKQAPFKVLTGVACPAVLVEVAFISNPDEEKSLLSEDFQERVAQAIYRGLRQYLQLYS
ncbi:MAG: N-acetylmuramoyl-L-alanine amidase [Acidobacteriota bacterium]|nr:N-acetylmuramoyl-L-alanine amidase [Acidobacteriota bacterium]